MSTLVDPWRPLTDTPNKGRPCLLAMDCAPGAGLDEGFVVGWHDGEKWHDVNSDEPYEVHAWADAWMYIPMTREVEF